MNVAMVSAPQVDRVASDKAKLRERISIRKLDFYYGDGRALKAISLPLFRSQGYGLHRPIRMRQVDVVARPEQDVRPLSKSACRG